MGNARTGQDFGVFFPKVLVAAPRRSGAVLRSNSKRLGKMARIRIQGTPNLKTAEIGAGGVGRTPQPIRAPLEVMNMWMEIPSWAFYGLRAAGCGFTPQ